MAHFERAVEVVKSLGGGSLLEGLEYIRDCLDNGEQDMLSRKSIIAYHLVCNEMRPLFFGPNK